MPGKRPRQIQRTTSMSQLGGAAGSTAMGTRFSQTAPGNFYGEVDPPQRGASAPLKPELFEIMEVCAGAENAVAPSALLVEDSFSSMAIDDGVEESLYASHTVRPVALQANDLGAQNQSLRAGYPPHPHPHPHPSPNKVAASQTSVYGVHEAGRSAQPRHFLDNCYLCAKRLGHGKDVFIYRGDRAFCSVECRHSQIVADEMRENCGMAAAKEGATANTPARNPPSTKQVGTAAAA